MIIKHHIEIKLMKIIIIMFNRKEETKYILQT
jgi:hypothetical protein